MRYQAVARAAIAEGQRLERLHADLPHTAFKGDGAERIPEYTAEHLQFYRAAQARHRGQSVPERDDWLTAPWLRWVPQLDAVQSLVSEAAWDAVDALLTIDFSTLRRAKIAAWYLLDRPEERQREHYEAQFWEALGAVHGDLKAFLANGRSAVPDDVAQLVLDLYYFRSAEALDWNAASAMTRITLADAVAASANFPPLFTPYKIERLYDRHRFDFLSLTDGGVNDNQGIDALVEDGCDYIIASDAGGLVLHQPEPADARLPMMDRIIEVLMGGLRNVQLNKVRSDQYVRGLLGTVPQAAPELEQLYRLKYAAVFHMSDRVKTELPARFDPAAVAGLRTDLDAFNGAEIEILKYEGYRLADARLREMLEDRDVPFSLDAIPPAVAPSRLPTRERAERILRGGARRLGRFSDAYPLWAALLAAILSLVLAAAGVDSYANIRYSWNHDDLAASVREAIANIDQLRATGSPETTALADEITDLPVVRALRTVGETQHAVGHFFRDKSIGAWACAIWALFILIRGTYRKTQFGLTRLRFRLLDIIRANVVDLAAIFSRVTVIVSLVCFAAFLVTVHAKWLLGMIPLWTLPVAFVFAVAHHVFRRLWLIAGWMPEKKTLARFPFLERWLVEP